MQDMELTVSPLNSSEYVDASAPLAVSQSYVPGSDINDHDHLGSDVMPPHHRANELEYWNHHRLAELYAMEGEVKLYDLRAPSQLVVMYLVYFVPLFLLGIAGWVSQQWPATTPRGAYLLTACELLMLLSPRACATYTGTC
jgi:hypothetical protein